MAFPYKHLVLGVTGGIAAYKAAELVRLLIKQGIDVQVVMTEAAGQFITPLTMQSLSGKPVFTSMWDGRVGNGMPHIELSREADAILIAPASADFLAKLVHGNADDLLSTLCLARDCPLVLAPAMNRQMWENPATQRNVAQLTADGIQVLGPAAGEQACGETGQGRMLEPDEIIGLLSRVSQRGILSGKRILVTAGPTVEHFDPVRAITNLSSGKMGYSIAQAAIEMGADVTLVSGPVSLSAPPGTTLIPVTSAQDMLYAVMSNIQHQDIFISVAAVSDYRPVQVSTMKHKKDAQALSIELVPNEDILAKVASLPNCPFCVGFAAESQNLLVYAEQKRRAKKLPLIAANLVSDSLGKDQTSITLLDDAGEHPLPHGTKPEVARLLLQHIAHMIHEPSLRKTKP